MVQVLLATLFLLLLTRHLRMPRLAWQLVLAGAVLVLAGSQLLPPGTPLREDVRASIGTVAWFALAALPVLGYVLLIRRIRMRTLSENDQRSEARPHGLVLIPDDSALVRDTEAALSDEGDGYGEHVSVAWRNEGGDLAGHVRLRLRRDLADLEFLWVMRESRGRGIGGRLLGQAETEARLRGASGMLAAVWNGDGAAFLSRHGYRPYGAFGPRLHLHKPLP